MLRLGLPKKKVIQVFTFICTIYLHSTYVTYVATKVKTEQNKTERKGEISPCKFKWSGFTFTLSDFSD